MKQQKPYILAINGGSSSIKFALYQKGDPSKRPLHVKVDRIGSRGTTLTFDDLKRNQQDSRIIGDLDHRSAATFLIDWLDKQFGLHLIEGVGHRVVNGGARFNEPQRVTGDLLDALRRISTYAPEHLPSEIAVIELLRERIPNLSQVVSFDTAFHRSMPQVARILPIPRRFQAQGVERYGFHGLSYTFLMEELARVAGAGAALGSVILAHLGNGASLAAVRGGKCIDTSMGFTPAAGVPMSTRSGDLDPGLDSLVFAGGIGENAPAVRARICNGLAFLGIEIEDKRNVTNAGVISAETSRVAVRVMHTDEEVMIAKSVCQVLRLPIEKGERS